MRVYKESLGFLRVWAFRVYPGKTGEYGIDALA